MTDGPKRPRAKERAHTADDVSVTGRSAGSDDDSPRLETFEQEPRRGSEDARLQQDVPPDPSSSRPD